MKDVSFSCDGLSGPVSLIVTDTHICLEESGKAPDAIRKDALTAIHFLNHAWSTRERRLGMVLSFQYKAAGKHQVRELVLSCGPLVRNDLLNFLDAHFTGRSFIGPSDRERENVLGGSYKGIYRLHRLHIMTPSGILLLMLSVALILSVAVPATMAPEFRRPFPGLYQARMVMLVAAVIMGIFLLMILLKRFMVLRTDQEGLMLWRIFSGARWSWDKIAAGPLKIACFNVYTGLFCYYSDQVNVYASSTYLEIPLTAAGGTSLTVQLPLDEAGRFYRELYYRDKVSLEEARSAGAFP